MKTAVSSAAKDNAAASGSGRRAAHPVPAPKPVFEPVTIVRRRCACGGACPNCRNDEARVQLRVKVGSPGDRYELEADRVAEQVMRMPSTAPSLGAAEPSAQRACRNCGPDEEEPEQISRKAAGPVQPASPVMDGHALTSGGDSLPANVRGFFESRFDRDFSHVRVHTGPAAERLNDHLQAYAFTYSNHIWLGQGQTVGATSLLAHELTHVLQQEPRARLSLENRTAPTATTDSEPIVRRFVPFWEPGDFTSGEDNHRIVLPAMGAHNSIFTEAPVPNAKTSEGFGFGIGHGFARKGSADFYKADPETTVGVYFVAHIDHRPRRSATARSDSYDLRAITTKKGDTP